MLKKVKYQKTSLRKNYKKKPEKPLKNSRMTREVHENTILLLKTNSLWLFLLRAKP
jgi:hypothetical protein